MSRQESSEDNNKKTYTLRASQLSLVCIILWNDHVYDALMSQPSNKISSFLNIIKNIMIHDDINRRHISEEEKNQQHEIRCEIAKHLSRRKREKDRD